MARMWCFTYFVHCFRVLHQKVQLYNNCCVITQQCFWKRRWRRRIYGVAREWEKRHGLPFGNVFSKEILHKTSFTREWNSDVTHSRLNGRWAAAKKVRGREVHEKFHRWRQSRRMAFKRWRRPKFVNTKEKPQNKSAKHKHKHAVAITSSLAVRDAIARCVRVWFDLGRIEFRSSVNCLCFFPVRVISQRIFNNNCSVQLTGQSRMSPILPALRSNWPNDGFWWFCAENIFCDVSADADT